MLNHITVMGRMTRDPETRYTRSNTPVCSFTLAVERDRKNEDGSRADALGIVPLHAKRDMLHRFNSVQLCSFENMELVGFKAEFSQLYGDNAGFGFAGVKYGIGINKESRLEGVRINNFFSTSMVGPFAVMNPLFVKYLMRLLGVEDPVLAHEEVIMAAYNKRLEDIKRMMNNKK